MRFSLIRFFGTFASALALTLSFACSTTAAPRDASLAERLPAQQVVNANVAATRVLFVGNSQTGFNNLPGLFRELAGRAGSPVFVGVSLKFGKSISDHLADASFQNIVSSNSWDFIVLQEYSTLTAADPQAALANVAGVRNLVKNSATRILLYETWPWASMNRSQMKSFDSAFRKVAAASNATVVHTGDAFMDMAAHTEIGMYVDDRHPTPIATYMNTLMFLKAILGIDPLTVAPIGANQNTPDVVIGEALQPALFELQKMYTPDDVRIIQEAVKKHSTP